MVSVCDPFAVRNYCFIGQLQSNSLRHIRGCGHEGPSYFDYDQHTRGTAPTNQLCV